MKHANVFNKNLKHFTMKQFLLLLHEDMANVSLLTAQEMEALANAHMDWANTLAAAGHLVAGDGLQEQAVLITGKDCVVKDGPYLESKEIIGGYYVLKADNLESVIELAKGCPTHLYGGTTEIRPIMEMEDYAQ